MTEQQDKTEKPSPRRLQQAREKGQAAKSSELSSLVTLMVFCLALIGGLGAVAASLAGVLRSSIAMAGASPVLDAGFARWLLQAWSPVWHALAPALFALLIAAVAINMLQTGPIFSLAPLKADLSRLNPMQGIKRVWSLRTVWDLLRLLLKLAALGAMAAGLARSMWPDLLATAAASPSAIGMILAHQFTRITRWMLLVLGAIALLDLLFSRREFLRKLRMSKRELKDEHKSQEGDPAIRSKRRRLAREMLGRIQAIGKVAAADVVLTNPTHVAVALQYRSSRMLAPIVLAKGSGLLAARIRQLAARHGVPIVPSPTLARALFKQCGIDEPIPADRYTDVGGVYRWVMARPGHKVHT